MGRLFISLMGLLMLGSAAQAGALSDMPEHYPPAPGYSWGPPTSGYSYAFCRAETVCPNGVPVGCYAYGNSYYNAACEWQVIPGRYIECRGYNDMGIWAVSWFSCY